MLRYLATISLFLSGIAGYTIDKFGQDLCIYEYISMNSVTYFKELNGVSANDPSMLAMCGLVSIIFSIVLIFIKNKYIYSSFAFILIIIVEACVRGSKVQCYAFLLRRSSSQ